MDSSDMKYKFSCRVQCAIHLSVTEHNNWWNWKCLLWKNQNEKKKLENFQKALNGLTDYIFLNTKYTDHGIIISKHNNTYFPFISNSKCIKSVCQFTFRYRSLFLLCVVILEFILQSRTEHILTLCIQNNFNTL